MGSGAGGIERGYGSQIDKHDTVVRINAAPTAGHERAVGGQTHIRVGEWSLSSLNMRRTWVVQAIQIRRYEVRCMKIRCSQSCRRTVFGPGSNRRTIALTIASAENTTVPAPRCLLL